MEILYHHRTQGRGAEGTHIGGIVRAFEALGHRVRIVSPPGITIHQPGEIPATEARRKRPHPNWDRLWRHLSHRLPQVIFEIMESSYNLYAYFALRSAIQATRPDFIYDRYALFSVAPLLIARLYNIRLVLEVNDATIIQRSRPLRLKRLARFIERTVFHQAPIVLTVSGYFKQLIVDAYGVPCSKIFVIPNAVDPERFPGADHHHFRTAMGLQDKSVIGVVGAFVPWHGIDFLIESVQHLLKGQKNLKVLLVGDGPALPQIDALVKRLGLQKLVECTGFVPSGDVPRYISCMDICLMPDSNEHGSPIKIFEYMAMGKPVVAPRYSPIEEIIEDGKTGILFKAHDKMGLCHAVQTLLNDGGLRNRLGAAAREYVLSHHSWDANAQRVLSILQCSM
jgi:glycosyltransferase involved in cell wall biosynthesis